MGYEGFTAPQEGVPEPTWPRRIFGKEEPSPPVPLLYIGTGESRGK